MIRLQIPERPRSAGREMVKMATAWPRMAALPTETPPRRGCADLRDLKKEGEVGKDDERRAESALQKQTDEAIDEIDTAL